MHKTKQYIFQRTIIKKAEKTCKLHGKVQNMKTMHNNYKSGIFNRKNICYEWYD